MDTPALQRNQVGWLHVAGAFVVVVAATVMAGWVTNHRVLVQWLPSGSVTVVNSAVCALVSGAGLLALAAQWRTAAAACGVAVVLFASAALAHVLSGLAPGLDDLFWKHQWGSALFSPGQMTPNSCVAFALVGAMIAMLALARADHWLLPVMGGVVAAFAFVPLVNNIVIWLGVGAAPVYRGMALPTVACLLALATALLGRTQQATDGKSAAQTFMAAALGMLISIGVVTVQNDTALVQANQLVVHTHVLRGKLDHFLSEVARMESSTRAFALTGEDYFRTRADFHRDAIVKTLGEVRALVMDNPVQAARELRLRVLVEEKFAQGDELARVRQASGPAAASRYLLNLVMAPGRPTSNLVNLADAMRAAEERLLLEREAAQVLVERNTRAVQTLGSAFALALLGAALVAARRAAAARQLAESARAVSEGRFRQLTAAAFEGVVISENGVVLDLNNQALAILGYERAEVVGQKIFKFVAPESRALVEDAVRSGRETVYEQVLLRKDGSKFHAESQAKIVQEGGRGLRMTALRDITERRQHEAALRESEEHFRRAFEDAGIGMALIGLDGRWLRVNRAICEIVGYAEAQLLEKTFQDITHPDDLQADLAHVRELLAGQRRTYGMEKRYFHREGHVVWINLTVSLVRDSAGQPVHFVSQIEDITARKELAAKLAEARDQALAASRLKSEFLATMSHEIRTPMNGIIGMVNLLLDSPLTDDQQQMAQVLHGSAESLLNIINDILDFSKIEAGKLRLQPVDFALLPLVDEILALFAPRAHEKQLELVNDFDLSLDGQWQGDAGRIRQVLTNLVGNAIKFTTRGDVVVEVRRVPESRAGRTAVRFVVRDTGIGIVREAQARLFQPFMQADATTTRRFGGTGLGLAISRQLVELMGGTIGFESEPGRGATFWFELALVERSALAALPSRASPRAPAVASLHVLLVEDNAANQIVTRLLLAKLGHTLDLAVNGREALAKLAARAYDVVLMDCQMPELDGYEATRRIRTGEVAGLNPRIPIIALTAYGMADDRQKCLDAGMDDYIAKPVRAEKLQQALARFGTLRTGSAPVPPIAPADGVLDLSVLEGTRELPGRNGPSLLPELVKMFLHEEPLRLDECARFAAEKNAAQLARTAHTLAGSCANLGAPAMRVAALSVERAASVAAWDEVAAQLSVLRAEGARVRAALARNNLWPA